MYFFLAVLVLLLRCQHLSLTIMVGVPQGPGLIGVKVRVASYAWAREIGVGEESPLPVEG